MTTKRTEIDKLGEFGLIDHLTENFETKNASTVDRKSTRLNSSHT